jgi:sporulation protein YlmC with PRC-barrel domain
MRPFFVWRHTEGKASTLSSLLAARVPTVSLPFFGEKTMKTDGITSAIFGVIATGLLLISTSHAQQGETREPPRNNFGQQTNRDGAQVGVLDERTRGANIRASQLIGMNIENAKGEGVGEINDLVIDGNSGRVRYAAVTYGGVLGVGDKMFAVPFEAFKVRRQAGDEDDYVLTLSVTQEQLEGAEGFDQENWPNFADRNFTSEIDRRYGIDRRRMRPGNRNRGRIDRDRTDLNRDADVDDRR